MYSFDAGALELLLVQALTTSDRLEYDQVGAHVATALDALRRENEREGRPGVANARGWFPARPD
jgi:hypothetical protein